MAPQPHRLSRTAPGVLALEVLDPPRRDNPFERLFRSEKHPLRADQSVRLSEVAVHVDAAQAGLFTRARFEFESDLDATRSCFLVWKNAQLQHLPLPRVGQSVHVDHEPGPLGL
jgi:hypothetical protein